MSSCLIKPLPRIFLTQEKSQLASDVQGTVLSLLTWTLIVDDFLWELEKENLNMQAFADSISIVVHVKCVPFISKESSRYQISSKEIQHTSIVLDYKYVMYIKSKNLGY